MITGELSRWKDILSLGAVVITRRKHLRCQGTQQFVSFAEVEHVF